MRRRKVPVSQGRFICVKTRGFYLDVTLNGNVLLISHLNEARETVKYKSYRLGHLARQRLHDGKVWDIDFLLLIAEM